MRVYLSLGSNIGDRAANIRQAIGALGLLDGSRLVAVSRCYETEPVGVTEQAAFLNAAAELETPLSPQDLLKAAKTIEAAIGRRPGLRWGPRVIDIDIILWGGEVLESEVLTIPHREFRKRAFVLVPLREIAPDAVDPVTGRTVAQLAEAVEGLDTIKDLRAL